MTQVNGPDGINKVTGETPVNKAQPSTPKEIGPRSGNSGAGSDPILGKLHTTTPGSIDSNNEYRDDGAFERLDPMVQALLDSSPADQIGANLSNKLTGHEINKLKAFADLRRMAA